MPITIDASWHPLVDGVPPRWASEWGQDRFGVYVAFSLGAVTQRMRWIPPGRFDMGSPGDEAGRWDDEGPQHAVTISRGFWMFDTACTEALWEAVTGKPCEPRCGAMFPATGVSWDDARLFIDHLNAAKKGLDLTLPSEAQWEYACRAGTQTPYNFGTGISKDLVCYEARGPVPVGSLPANAWGLREMHGNVWEWCSDHWHDSYEGAPAHGSAGVDDHAGAAFRVFRGGSWYYDARYVRSAYRDHLDPASRSGGLGFRCARVQ